MSLHLIPASELPGRKSRILLEYPAEVGNIPVAYKLCNIFQQRVCVNELLLGLLQAQLSNEPVDRYSFYDAELVCDIVGVIIKLPDKFLYGDRFCIML